jgi:hypothetical protein
MIDNDTRDWIRDNSKVVKALASNGHRVPKLIIDAYSQYRNTGDDRWLGNLMTNIHTYIRWQQTVEGKAALDSIRSPKGRSEHRTPAPHRQQVEVATRATQRAIQQTKSGRTLK